MAAAPSRQELLQWLTDYLVRTLHCSPGDVDPERSLKDLGMGSAEAVVLSGELSDVLGKPVDPVEFWQHPSINALLDFLTGSPQAAVAQSATAESRLRDEPIAVIGLACRFPGDISSPEELWQFLSDGRSAVTEVPADRASLAATTKWGAFLTGLDQFDAEFFEISPREADKMDPQQRLLLEVAWEALEDAGIPPTALRRSPTGVFVGACAADYAYLASGDPADVDPWTNTGGALSIIANRLSYFLDLRGPSVVVDTACSSSLVAVHTACQSLRSGDCDMAIAAGVNVLLSPATFGSFDQAGALSPTGACHSFDSAADGFVRGEGCGVAVLKRLSDAIRDQDRVMAVIRGSAINSDGRSNGLMAPNPAAQIAVLRAAYANAGIPPNDVDYVETQGSGTLLGDPIEARALGTALGRGRAADAPLLVGAINSNLGHLEAAAGIARFIKAVLALQRGVIPPTRGFETPNPHIQFHNIRLEVVARERNWPDSGHRRRAGVSAFGFGGTNAHVVLEQSPDPPAAGTPAPQAGPAPAVTSLVVTGKTPDRLSQWAQRLADWIETDGADIALADIAHTLNHHRVLHPLFATVCARDHDQAVAALRALAVGESAAGLVGPHPEPCSPGTVFVYSGEGSQWAGMGRRLLAEEPAFAEAVAELEPDFIADAGFSLQQTLLSGESVPGTEYSGPALFGIQLALTALWRSYGIEPDAVIGDSVGEVTAAVVGGAVSVTDGLRVIAAQSCPAGVIDAAGLRSELAALPAIRPQIPVITADRFTDAVTTAAEGHTIFIEISPHPLLTEVITDALGDRHHHSLPTLQRDTDDTQTFHTSLNAAHTTTPPRTPHLPEPHPRLPATGWQHTRFWYDTDEADLTGGSAFGSGTRSTADVHLLLGAHVRLPEEPERHAWQSDVGTAAIAWLTEHRVRGVPALPGAAYCEMALAAAHALFPLGSECSDVVFEDLLLLDQHTEITTVASVEGDGVANLSVFSGRDGERVRLSTATLRSIDDGEAPRRRDIGELLGGHPGAIAGEEVRTVLRAHGIDYGPAFSGLVAVHTAGNGPTMVAELRATDLTGVRHGGLTIHPALLDACFQSVAVHPSVIRRGNAGLMLPLRVAELRCYGSCADARYCHITITSSDASAVEADIAVLDAQGAVLLDVIGLRMGSGSARNAERDRLLAERLLTVEWEPREVDVAEVPAPGQRVITAAEAGDEFAERLTRALGGIGADCRMLTAGSAVDAEGVTAAVFVAPSPGGAPTERSAFRARDIVGQIVHLAQRLAITGDRPPRLYVVTRGAQAVDPGDVLNLEQAGVRGLLRALGAEHPALAPTQIDVDRHTGADTVAREILCGSAEDEIAWRDGQRYVARLQLSPLRPDERRTALAEFGRDAICLQVRTPGDIETLELAVTDRIEPGPGQIEVAVGAAGVTFTDALVITGRYGGTERPAPGLDFAGVVTAVGPDVTGHRVGDCVGGLSPDGCWRNFVTVDADLAVGLPPDMTADDAAALSSAYAIAWHALHGVARIRAGDKVLIHCATGGVGQAAVAIARRAGAEVFATAGSPERRALLRDRGMANVYDSRGTEFAELIRQDTQGSGVDIVLNPLPGAARRAGLELLATGGRFVEIGHLDAGSDTRLGLGPLRRNLSFNYLDLSLMCRSDPLLVRQTLSTVYRLVAEGELPPLQSIRYALADAATAIRAMSEARHTGRPVLTMPTGGTCTVVEPPEQAPVFRRDGSYIVTGGLGGLGLLLAGGMATAGCGRIVLTGRSQPNAAAEKAIARIRATGADIAVECGNLAEPETAARLVSTATATGLPLRGVLHAAAVQGNTTLSDLTDELLDRDWSSKVYGAWHLHEATSAEPLDWFCSFSSAAALLGSPEQIAYAAANSWLDAFTRWRHAEGRPASAIAWGEWAGRGAPDDGRPAITAEQGAYAFQRLLRHARVYTGYVPIAGAPWLAPLIARAPFAEALQSAFAEDPAATSAVRSELLSLPREEWPDRLESVITELLGVTLRRSVDPDRPFAEHGLDSLGNLELRTRIETETGIRINPKVLATHNTVRALARLLSETLAADLTA